jgi:hypothetical protein
MRPMGGRIAYPRAGLIEVVFGVKWLCLVRISTDAMGEVSYLWICL